MIDTPTGRQRHRVQLVGWPFDRRQVLVLQIEIRGLVTVWAGNHCDTEIKNWWIDARPEHLIWSDSP